MSMKNKGRHFTLMVIPHTEESVLSLRIPLFLLQLLSVLVVVSLLVAFVAFHSYWKVPDDNITVEKLRAENRLLGEQLDLLASTTEELLAKVEQVEHLGHEVRRMVELPPAQGNERDSLGAIAFNDDNLSRVLPGRGGNQVIDRTVMNISLLQDLLLQRTEEMLQLKEEVLEYKRELASTPSIWPTRGRVTSEFGPRRSPFTGRREFHDGIDIAAPRGTPIYATADGKVSFAVYRRGIGNYIMLDHGYGYQTIYGHLSGFAVSRGDTVNKGQLIGYMGNTGMSTGPHLHYTVFVNGVAVNPRDYMP
ncbi:MAG: M23 family metallopeptidase [Bacillota bacterium]